MTLTSAILQFLIAAVIVVLAGNALKRFADGIAALTKRGRLLVGSIFLAGATSLPELTVDITAGRMLSRAAAAHALSATASIALTALVAIAIYVGSRIGAFSLLGIGMGSFAVLGAYLLAFRLVYYDQRHAAEELRKKVELPMPKMKLRTAILGFMLCAGAILLAAPFAARSAGRIAELSGLGNTFVGTTLVAFRTSLPELVAPLAAVCMKAFDLALIYHVR